MTTNYVLIDYENVPSRPVAAARPQTDACDRFRRRGSEIRAVRVRVGNATPGSARRLSQTVWQWLECTRFPHRLLSWRTGGARPRSARSHYIQRYGLRPAHPASASEKHQGASLRGRPRHPHHQKSLSYSAATGISARIDRFSCGSRRGASIDP